MSMQYLYNQFPVLDLGDVILRELISDDGEAYFGYMNKPEMHKFLTDNNRPADIDRAKEELNYWASLFRNRRGFYWGIALKDNNQLIGTAGFNAISIMHQKAEISYDLDYAFWGRGIMLKSVKAILKFIEHAAIIRIQATVIHDNTRSIKLLERCGFLQEGLMKKYEIVEGVHRDYYMYAKVY